MMKKNITLSLVFALVIGIMLILPLTSATTYIDKVNNDGGYTPVGDPVYKGVQVTVNSNVTVLNITTFVGDTSPYCRIYNSTFGLLVNSTVVNNNASFNYNLSTGNTYYLGCGGGGNMAYNLTAFVASNGTAFNFINQFYDTSIANTAYRTFWKVTYTAVNITIPNATEQPSFYPNLDLGGSKIDSNQNAIGAYIYSAFYFVPTYNFTMKNLSIYITDINNFTSNNVSVGIYGLNATNGINISDFYGNSTNVIKNIVIDNTYNFSFSGISLTKDKKYIALFTTGYTDAQSYIRIGETAMQSDQRASQWLGASSLNDIIFKLSYGTRVESYNMKLWNGSISNYSSPYYYYSYPYDTYTNITLFSSNIGLTRLFSVLFRDLNNLGSNYTINIYNSTLDKIGSNTTYSLSDIVYNLSYSYTFNFSKYYYNVETTDSNNFLFSSVYRSILFTPGYYGVCNNSTANSVYLNISFTDEDTGVNIASKIKDFEVIDNTNTLLYSLTNLTPNYEYSFCGYSAQFPANLTVRFYYLNDSYTQKFYSTTSLFNGSTMFLKLTLLPTASSHLVSLQTLDERSVPIPNTYVQVFSISSGITSQVFSGYTDTTGVIATYLNGVNNYVINYTKSGYNVYTQTVQPALSSYSIYMTKVSTGTTGTGAGIGTQTGGSYIPQNNISWVFWHTPVMWYFNSTSSITVNFNVTTTDTHYGGSRIEVWNNTAMLNWTNVNKSVGNLTHLNLTRIFNNNKNLIFKYYIYNSSDITTYYKVYQEEFKLVNVTDSPTTLSGGIKSWGNWIYLQGFEEQFSTAWWALFFLCIGIALFCYTTGVELTNPMAISIGFTAIIGVMCYAKFLYIPGLYNEFVNQYIIVIIVALFNIGHISATWRER